MRAETGERIAQLGSDGLDVAKGDRRRDERHELLIERVLVVMYEAYRVALASSRYVARCAHLIERTMERRHGRMALTRPHFGVIFWTVLPLAQ